MKNKPRIVIDAMGGDHAPRSIIDGAASAHREFGSDIILVGKADIIKNELLKLGAAHLPLSVVHASEVIHMEDNPLDVVRKKKDSSIRVGMDLLLNKKADAFLSAGNSGAVASSALFMLKRIKGIDRPAITAVMPTLTGHVVVADAGANSVCKPYNLVQFAIMNTVYCRYILKCAEPRVGIISNGEEETKGTDTLKQAHALLKKSSLNYIGYIEGRDLFKGDIDVAICDGFTGNVLLKVAEGVAESFGFAVKQELSRTFLSKLGYLFARSSFHRLKNRFDYSEYGGAPLLGVNGSVLIGHGSSNAHAIKNAAKAAADFASAGIVNMLQSGLKTNSDLEKLGKKPSFIDKVLHDIHIKKSDKNS